VSVCNIMTTAVIGQPGLGVTLAGLRRDVAFSDRIGDGKWATEQKRENCCCSNRKYHHQRA